MGGMEQRSGRGDVCGLFHLLVFSAVFQLFPKPIFKINYDNLKMQKRVPHFYSTGSNEDFRSRSISVLEGAA